MRGVKNSLDFNNVPYLSYGYKLGATKPLQGAKDKDRVMVQLTKWDKSSRKPEGEVINVFTPEQENEMAMKSIVAEAGFALEFTQVCQSATPSCSE